MKALACVILAAGDGTRMKSELPKVLHTVSGIPMLEHVLRQAESLKPERIIVVAGYKKPLVASCVGKRAAVVEQKERRGSGHAVMQAMPRLKGFDGAVLVLCGDMPLLRPQTVKDLVAEFRKSECSGVVLTGAAENPAGYGRIVRDGAGNVTRIVEEISATEEERRIREINTGAYVFDRAALSAALKRLKPDPVKKEFYLTDTVALLADEGIFLGHRACDPAEATGINSRSDLARAERAMNARILERWMAEGVTVRDPLTTWIGADVKIGADTEILPNTVIEGPAVIGRRCHVGPFARIRGGVTLGDDVTVGNFVEVVRSTVGRGTLMKHLTYIGDAVVGGGVNVGCGTITANFDGKAKHQTRIGDRAQLGSGTVLVAPVKVGAGAKTGAGSVVTRGRDVPAGKTVIGVPAKVLNKGKGR